MQGGNKLPLQMNIDLTYEKTILLIPVVVTHHCVFACLSRLASPGAGTPGKS